MSAHTEGPWTVILHGNEVYPYPLSVESADGSEWVARAGTTSSIANARLIAAAPDMLEALENLENDNGKAMPATAWKMVQDAIAKAKGEQS